MPSLAPQGKRISAIRRVLGLTQLDLALRCGVSERTIRNAERGRPIMRDFLQFIAAGLGVSMDEVIHVSPDLSSQLRWQQNLELVMRVIRSISSEHSSPNILDIAHHDVTCRVQGSMPCFAKVDHLFGEFHGTERLHQFLDSVRDLWHENSDVDTTWEKPIGGGDSVISRCSHRIPLQSGQFTLRSALVCEFESLRLRRIDIYVAPSGDCNSTAHRWDSSAAPTRRRA
jgi:transcriptional regulator with XRE-family HTH domain